MLRISCVFIISLFSAHLLHGQQKSTKSDTLALYNLFVRAQELQKNNPDSAFLLSKIGLHLSSSINYKPGVGMAFMRIASLFNDRGMNDSALLYTHRALGIRLRSNNPKAVFGSCSQLSYVFNTIGQKDSAFYYSYEALKFAEKSGDEFTMANAYTETGRLLSEYNLNSDALKFLQKAIALFLKCDDPEETATAYSNLAAFYARTNENKKALTFYLLADSVGRKSDNVTFLANSNNNLAVCYDKLNQYEKAKFHYAEALKFYLREDFKNAIAVIYYNLGVLQYNTNHPDTAIGYLNKSLSISKEINDPNNAADCLQQLAIVFAGKKDFQRAYLYHARYTALSDSLLNNEKVKQIAEMQTKYRTEKKENQIQLMGKEKEKQAALTSAETKRQKLVLFGVIFGLFLVVVFSVFMFNRWRVTQKQKLAIEKEKHRSEELLLNILPAEVAEELKAKGSADANLIDQVTVLFTDFKGFTQYSETLSPKQLVAEIHECFSAFDNIMEKHRVEKIKTIGDAYMAAGGLPTPNTTHATDVVNAALEIQAFMQNHKKEKEMQGRSYFEVRIGIHTGPVVAGIVGVKKFAYDIWGDTVNTASRMESSGEEGKVNISDTTYQIIKENFTCTHRGKVKAKNKGEIDMYFVSYLLS